MSSHVLSKAANNGRRELLGRGALGTHVPRRVLGRKPSSAKNRTEPPRTGRRELRSEVRGLWRFGQALLSSEQPLAEGRCLRSSAAFGASEPYLILSHGLAWNRESR